jgi:uncharacterized SAM-binding protein YcdF (DUF218 family)
MSRRRRFVAGILLAVVGLAALAVALHRPLLGLVAAALVVQEPLERADAIVVVAGGTPSREAAGAALFNQGWAPRVVISRPVVSNSIRQLTALGVRPLDLQGESKLVLEKYGVPPDHIIPVAEPARTTEPELDLVHQLARAQGYRRVILVTSPQHTRRVKVIWARQSRKSGIEGIVVAARDNDFELDDWWRKRRVAEKVLHEYLGLAAIYLGVSRLMR